MGNAIWGNLKITILCGHWFEQASLTIPQFLIEGKPVNAGAYCKFEDNMAK